MLPDLRTPEPADALGAEWVLRSIEVDSPGIGQTWSLKVPGEYEWRVIAVRQAFARSAAAGDRPPYLSLRRENRELVRVPAGLVVPPSGSIYLQWAAGVGELTGSTVEGMVLAPMPVLPMLPGMVLSWQCDALQAGDLAADIVVTVYERFTGSRPPTRSRRIGLVAPIDFGAMVGA